MHLDRLIQRMQQTPKALQALLQDLDDADARFRPPSGAWSIVEIVHHLADEETEDFRVRVRLTLEDPAKPWPALDPEGVAVERRYHEQSLADGLQRFARERESSIAWLNSLDNPDWNRAYSHPVLGELRAGDVMASWTAHDQLHLRQIAKRLFELTQRDAPAYDTTYAGAW